MHRFARRDSRGPAASPISARYVSRGFDQVGTLLQITGILGRLAVHQPRMRGRDDVTRSARSAKLVEQPLHRLRVSIELDDVVDDRLRACPRSAARSSTGRRPGPAMSASACLSTPRWIASSGRWKSSCSQFSTSLTLGFAYLRVEVVQALRAAARRRR